MPGKRILAFTAAERAPIALVISDSHYMFLDTRSPTSPARFAPRPLPQELDQLTAAAIDPKGKILAVILSKNNQIRLLDISRPGQLKSIASTKVLPQATAPLLRDFRFSPDASTLWVVSGDNPNSRNRGRFPMRLTAIKINIQRSGPAKSYGILSIWRTLDVPHQAAPVSLTVARGQPVVNGATVRVPPKNAAVFITAHDSKLLRLANTDLDRKRGLGRAVAILRGISPLGTLVRTDINGKGGPMFDSRCLLGSLDITSDSQLLVIAGAQVKTQRKPSVVKLLYGLISTRVFGKVKPTFLPLSEVDPQNLARPFLLGDIRIQP